MTNETADPFCGQGFNTVHDGYVQLHGYVSLFVCLFGSLANMVNIIVLTRKDMISPTNVVLTGLAVADLLVLVEYVPFTCHMYLRPKRYPIRDRYTYGWALFVLMHSNFSQVFHTISIWLTVTLAVWRYIAVGYPQRNRVWCRMETTYAVVAAGYILCPLLCVPVFLSFNIMPRQELLDEAGHKITTTIDGSPSNLVTTATTAAIVGRNTTLYVVNLSDIAKARGNLLTHLNFLIYSVVFKIIPCIMLTVLSLRLVFALIETKKRRQKLTSNMSRKTAINTTLTTTTKNSDKEKQTDRTTRMLLAVLILFLATEFPQGILGLLSIIFKEKFFEDCYQKLGEIVDILALINSAINFFLYYAMSRQFRTTFQKCFRTNRFTINRHRHGGKPSNKHNKNNNNNNNYDTTTNHTTLMMTQVTQV